jgi:hypothetical protein
MKYLLLILLFPLFSQAQVQGRLNLINIVRPVSGAIVSISPTFLPQYYAELGIASPKQTIYVTFSNLSGANGSITFPSGFEASMNTGTSFATSYTGIANGLDSFQVRVASTASVGNIGPINITATASGATTSGTCSVQATVTSNGPSIVLNPSTNILTTTTAGSQGGSISFTITARNLTGSTYTITAPANVIVSPDNTNFSSSYGGSFGGGGFNATVYAALPATAPAGNYSGYITVVSSGATVRDTVSGTVTSPSSTTYAFAFSLTQQTAPSGFVDVYGDPSKGVQTGTSNGVTVSSVATANWYEYGTASAFDNLGKTGSTISIFPDSVLYRGWFQYSGESGSNPAGLSDSANMGLGKPQLIVSGLNPGQSYTLNFVGSINPGFTSNNYYRAVGAASYRTPITLNCQQNISNYVSITGAVANGSGQIYIYVFTEPTQYLAVLSGLTIH